MGIYPNESKVTYEGDIYTPMVTVALRDQPRCPSADEQKTHMHPYTCTQSHTQWYIHNGVLFSH